MNVSDSATGQAPRVVIIDDFVFPYRVPFFAELARQAIDLTVFFCTSRSASHRWKPLEALGFEHEFLWSRVLRLRRGAHPERTIYLTPTLLFRLMLLKPDVVVAYAYSIPTIIAFIYCRMAGKSFVSWADGTPHSNKTLRAEQRWVRRFIIPRADACITPTPEGRESFLISGAAPKKVWMIPHSAAVEMGRLADDARRKHQTAADELAIKKPRALYVGSLLPQKGLSYLIEAIAQAQPARAELETRAQQLGIERNIHYLGFAQPADLPSVYAAADVFLFPSLSDTFAFVIGEAVRCGLPVVGSTFAGASRVLIEPGENGFVVDPTDVAAFSKAIVDVLGDEQTLTRMGRKSREIADRFSIEEAAQQTLRAIYAALARSTSSYRSAAELKPVTPLQTSMRACRQCSLLFRSTSKRQICPIPVPNVSLAS
jgi:glycosyltransferase involved in cell wall biosynthesis